MSIKARFSLAKTKTLVRSYIKPEAFVRNGLWAVNVHQHFMA